MKNVFRIYILISAAVILSGSILNAVSEVKDISSVLVKDSEKVEQGFGDLMGEGKSLYEKLKKDLENQTPSVSPANSTPHSTNDRVKFVEVDFTTSALGNVKPNVPKPGIRKKGGSVVSLKLDIPIEEEIDFEELDKIVKNIVAQSKANVRPRSEASKKHDSIFEPSRKRLKDFFANNQINTLDKA